MNLTIILKRLILAYLLIALFFIIAPFFVSQSLKVSYFNNSVDRNNAYNLFYIILGEGPDRSYLENIILLNDYKLQFITIT